MVDIPTDKFAWWIFGYQKFCEPIIRKCICQAKGWQDITGRATTPKPKVIRAQVLDRTDWGEDLESLRRRACEQLGRRERALELDAAFLTEKGEIAIGEFKSWGGFAKPFVAADLRKQISQGEFLADRLSITWVSYEGQERLVSRFVVATNLEGQGSEFPLGNLRVEVVDIARLLKDNIVKLSERKDDWFASLDEAVGKVKKYIEQGILP